MPIDSTRIFVLAGGPSLYGFDPSILDGERSIVINNAYLIHPHADDLVFCDLAWWLQHRQQVYSLFTGNIVTIARIPPAYSNGVTKLRNAGRYGLSNTPDALYHGGHSGYQAINLAYALGATTIIGLGFDLRTWTWADAADPTSYVMQTPTTLKRAEETQRFLSTNPEYATIPYGSHWHNGHNGSNIHQQAISLRDVILPSMKLLVNELTHDGARFVNCTPKSALTTIDYTPITALTEQPCLFQAFTTR